MLVTSIFSFSINVFKILLPQGSSKSGLCCKEIIKYYFHSNGEIVKKKKSDSTFMKFVFEFEFVIKPSFSIKQLSIHERMKLWSGAFDQQHIDG